jgi:hypothetical protein
VLGCGVYIKVEDQSIVKTFYIVKWTWFHINLGEKAVPRCAVSNN